MTDQADPVPASEGVDAKKGFRAVFFGTPQFAVPCLDALVEIADVVAVVCQPDKPQGRGLEVTPPGKSVTRVAWTFTTFPLRVVNAPGHGLIPRT